jgi:hypothetical protein
LLQLAAEQFDVLLTVDRNLEYQQNFSGLRIAVVVIVAPSNDIDVLRPFMSSVRRRCLQQSQESSPMFAAS